MENEFVWIDVAGPGSVCSPDGSAEQRRQRVRSDLVDGRIDADHVGGILVLLNATQAESEAAAVDHDCGGKDGDHDAYHGSQKDAGYDVRPAGNEAAR